MKAPPRLLRLGRPCRQKKKTKVTHQRAKGWVRALQRQAPRCGTVRTRVQKRRRGVASAVPRPLPSPGPCLPWRREAPAATDAAGTHQKPCSATTPLSVGRPSGDWPGGAGRRPPCAPRHGRGSREIPSPPSLPLLFPPPRQSICFEGVVHRGAAPCLVTPPLSPQVRVFSGQHGGSHVTAPAGSSDRPAALCTRVVVPTCCVRTVEKSCSGTQRPAA